MLPCQGDFLDLLGGLDQSNNHTESAQVTRTIKGGFFIENFSLQLSFLVCFLPLTNRVRSPLCKTTNRVCSRSAGHKSSGKTRRSTRAINQWEKK